MIGPGRLGVQLALRLLELEWRCVRVRGRRPPTAAQRALLPGVEWDWWELPATWVRPDLVLVTVSDRQLAAAAAALAGENLAGSVVLHTSGLATSEAIAPCRAAGAAVASWHPLQTFTFAATSGSVQWDGVACAVEGDVPAVAAGHDLARTLGMRPWRIRPQDKALYHAAAAVAGNLTHVLVAAARRELERCGLDRSAAAAALAPLVHASVDTALGAEAFEALTGALARGDTATVNRHLDALPEPLADAYRAVAEVFAESADTLLSR